MAGTPRQEESHLAPKQVSSTSSIETLLGPNHGSTMPLNAMQPVVSHQSLDTTIPPQNAAAHEGHSSQQFTPSPDQTISQPQNQSNAGIPTAASASAHNTNAVPEFLYQLTKMLTDNNRDIIEWSKGKIEVHNPHKLQTHVLNRYFRHSKFASFQRQLNYFGFRKLAGKGKMAPCSYVNDATTKELGSLLYIKRKVGNETNKVKSTKKRDRSDSSVDRNTVDALQNPLKPARENLLHGCGMGSAAGTREIQQSAAVPVRQAAPLVPDQSQQDIARHAVGRGIRHSFSLSNTKKPAPLPPRPDQPPSFLTDVQHETSQSQADSSRVVESNLSALASNYQNSLNVDQPPEQGSAPAESMRNTDCPSTSYVPGSLSHNDSLVDLAMIPLADDNDAENQEYDSLPFTFIDFPWHDPNSPGG